MSVIITHLQQKRVFKPKTILTLLSSNQPLVMDSLSKSDLDYGGYSQNSTHLLSKWLNTLENQSSLFWLHCIGCNRQGDEDEAREGSLSSNEGTDSLGDDQSVFSEGFEEAALGVSECKSIAHRDSELLLALTENCSLGPVCYFCR